MCYKTQKQSSPVVNKFTKYIGGPSYGSLNRPYATSVINGQYCLKKKSILQVQLRNLLV